MAKLQNRKIVLVPAYLRVVIFVFLFLGVLVAGGAFAAMLGAGVQLTTMILGALSIALIYVLRTQLDRASWLSLGWQWKGYEKHFAAGSCIAVVILGLGTCLLAFTEHIQWVDVRWDGQSFFLSLGLMVMVSIYEELAFRGYIQGNLMDAMKPLPALLVSAVIFALFHGSNPGASIFSILNVFLAGILLGMNYMFTRNLWFGIGLHFVWNFAQGPVLGYQVSGLALPSILVQEQSGSAIWTGGDFGFEGSVVNSVLLVLMIGVYLAWGKGRV